MRREVILVGLFLLMGSDARQQTVDIDWTGEEDGGETTDVAGDEFDRNEPVKMRILIIMYFCIRNFARIILRGY